MMATALPKAPATGSLYFIALPEETYRALSDEAARLDLTLAQLLSRALNDYLSKEPREPRLLLEGKEK